MTRNLSSWVELSWVEVNEFANQPVIFVGKWEEVRVLISWRAKSRGREKFWPWEPSGNSTPRHMPAAGNTLTEIYPDGSLAPRSCPGFIIWRPEFSVSDFRAFFFFFFFFLFIYFLVNFYFQSGWRSFENVLLPRNETTSGPRSSFGSAIVFPSEMKATRFKGTWVTSLNIAR